MALGIFITILLISQVYLFYLVFNRLKKPRKIKEGSIILEPAPKYPTYIDIDPNAELVYDVMKSIKLENWDLELEDELRSRESYRFQFKNHDSTVSVRSRLSFYSSNNPHLVSFYISGNKGSVGISYEKFDEDNYKQLKNDILIFLWEYVLEYHRKKNKKESDGIKDSIKAISNKLKSLKRSEKISDILST